MLQETSERFKKFFLLEFTRELINNYVPKELVKLEEIVEKKDEEIVKEKPKPENSTIKEIVKSHDRKLRRNRHVELQPIHLRTSAERLRENVVRMKHTKPILKVPEPRLPPTMDYLKPSPSRTNVEMDLGKLNPIIQDPLVKVIECNGPEENVFVRGAMGTKPTRIVLNKEEIDEVIKTFSEETRIPADEGVFKAVTGRLIISAIVSETVGSKFIIKKMAYQPNFFPQR